MLSNQTVIIFYISNIALIISDYNKMQNYRKIIPRNFTWKFLGEITRRKDLYQ